jgi:hypothetical protein
MTEATSAQLGVGVVAGGGAAWYLSTAVYKQKYWLQWLMFLWGGSVLGFIGMNIGVEKFT